MAQKYQNLSALDWDDSALIKAYDRGMSLRIKDFEGADIPKENKESSKKRKEWKKGDFCRAVYSGDGVMYEAEIIDICDDYCIVEYLGYDDEAEVKLEYLAKSHGKNARKKQIKNARENYPDNDVDESVSGDDVRNGRHNVSYNPDRSYFRKKHHRNDSHILDHTTNYTAAESTFHSAFPVARCPELPNTTIPPPFITPPCADIQNPSYNAMMTAWYMAGYYTGFFQGQKSVSQHSCCCRRSNCHQ